MKPIKVLFVNHSSRMGGAEKVLFDLLENLDNQLIEATLISPPGILADKVKAQDIPCIELEALQTLETTRTETKFSDLFSVLKIIKKINSIIKQVQPDIIYSNSAKAHILINYKKRKEATIIRLHDFPSSFQGKSLKLLKLSLSNANVISCVSKSVSEDVKSLLGDDSGNKVTVNYNGIELNEPNEAKDEPNLFSKPRIVIAGWLFAMKGFDVFVEAMEDLAETLTEWDFVIAGGVANDTQESLDYSASLKDKIKESKFKDRFIIYGGYKSLGEVLGNGVNCIFVQPSLRPDALPTVILEASKYRVPIIASNLGGSKEIIENGVNGILISPEKKALVEEVRKLVNNMEYRVNLGNSIYQTVINSFSMTTYINDMQSLIKKVMLNHI